MDEQTPIAGTPIYQQSQERNAKWLWLLIALIIIAAVGFAFYKGIGPLEKFRFWQTKIEASPTPELSTSFASPEATTVAEVDRSVPKIRILNGSGKAGAASSIKDFLEGKGYKVSTLGNAKTYDFTQTVVKFKDSFINYKDVLFADLENDYSPTEASESLDATDSADIEVTIGTK